MGKINRSGCGVWVVHGLGCARRIDVGLLLELFQVIDTDSYLEVKIIRGSDSQLTGIQFSSGT